MCNFVAVVFMIQSRLRDYEDVRKLNSWEALIGDRIINNSY